jgi:RNA polymerase sigma-70 factor, ECF subfamily
MDLGPRIADHRINLIRRAVWLGVAPQDADDVVHDVVITALSKSGEYVEDNFRGWLKAILGFHVWDYHRRRARRRRQEISLISDGEDGQEISHDIALPGSQLPALELFEALRALASLPEHYRDIIESVTMCGMRYSDYADRRGIPLGTVKSRLARAHELLRHRFAEGVGAAGDRFLEDHDRGPSASGTSVAKRKIGKARPATPPDHGCEVEEDTLTQAA